MAEIRGGHFQPSSRFKFQTASLGSSPLDLSIPHPGPPPGPPPGLPPGPPPGSPPGRPPNPRGLPPEARTIDPYLYQCSTAVKIRSHQLAPVNSAKTNEETSIHPTALRSDIDIRGGHFQFKFQVPGSRLQFPGSRFQSNQDPVLPALSPAPATYPSPSRRPPTSNFQFKFQVPGSRFQFPGSRFQSNQDPVLPALSSAPATYPSPSSRPPTGS